VDLLWTHGWYQYHTFFMAQLLRRVAKPFLLQLYSCITTRMDVCNRHGSNDDVKDISAVTATATSEAEAETTAAVSTVHHHHNNNAAEATTTHHGSSPTARAFFAALDHHHHHHQNNDTATTTSSRKQQSAFIQKRIQTLGWRNRYSQDEFYPLTIQCNSINGDDDHNNSNNTSTSSNTHTFRVQQVQRGELENTYGTGATVWPASIVLIKYLQRHASTLIQDMYMIDLGAGTAITTIAAAILGAKHIVCTDGEMSVVQLAQRNIGRTATEWQQPLSDEPVRHTTIDTPRTDKGRDDFDDDDDDDVDHQVTVTTETLPSPVTYIGNCSIETQRYWWGTPGMIQSQVMIEQNDDAQYHFDIILVSDCVLPKLYPIAPLVDAIDQLLLPKEYDPQQQHHTHSVVECSEQEVHWKFPLAILSYEHRYYPDYDPRTKFCELCQEKQLHVEIIPTNMQDPIYSTDDIEIWHVYRRRP
jgi:predicted nicotinamide N-methyase